MSLARPTARLALLATTTLTVALTGCGNERAAPPDVTAPEAPRGARAVDDPAAGLAYRAPGNWRAVERRDPLVGGIESRRATLAIWRYVRTEPLPATRAQLVRVRRLLIERIRARDASFELTEARLTRRGGARAIELTGRQTIAGRRVGVRSAHVFGEGAEVVVDAHAPPEAFPRVDRTVFEPILTSLRLRTPGS